MAITSIKVTELVVITTNIKVVELVAIYSDQYIGYGAGGGDYQYNDY